MGCRAARQCQEEGTPSASLLLHDNPALVDEHAVAASVLARRDVVILALFGSADDLPARLALQSDDGRQILENRWVIRGRCGLGAQGDGQENRGRSLRAAVHLLLQ